MKSVAILTTSLLLAACNDKPAAQANASTMHCDAGGLKLSGTGSPEVGIASFGIKGDIITGFGLGLDVTQGAKAYQVSSSLMPLPMQAGTYHFPALTEPGMTLASFKVRTADHDLIKGYNGGTYSQQFSPVENDPDAKLKVQINQINVSDAALPGFKHVHAVGSFDFNAAALPGDSPSDACTTDGVRRSLLSVKAGKRLLPMFDAALCGAEKTHVHCDFDVAADLVELK